MKDGESDSIFLDPGVKARIEQLAFTPVGDTPTPHTAFGKSEIAKWSKVAKESGTKMD